MNIHGEQKKAKLRFILLYACSLVLIFIVVTAFWKRGPGTVQATAENTDIDGYFMQVDTALHTKMNELEKLYADYLKSTRAPESNEAKALFAAKYHFAASLDSIEKQSAVLKDGEKKQMLNLAVAEFRNSLNAKDKLMTELFVLPKENPVTIVAVPGNKEKEGTTNEVDELKNMLVDKEQIIADLEKKINDNGTGAPNDATGLQARWQSDLAAKDKTIAALQVQVKQLNASAQRPVSTPTNVAANTEWKRRYEAMKVAYDKKASSEASLKNAYKTIADDNRRLLAQLQSLRKG